MTILIVRKETCCRHIGYSYRLTAGFFYMHHPRQDSTYHGLCYTSRGALAGMRNSSMGPPHEESIQRPIAPWANALTTELHLAPSKAMGVKSNFRNKTLYYWHAIPVSVATGRGEGICQCTNWQTEVQDSRTDSYGSWWTQTIEVLHFLV